MNNNLNYRTDQDNKYIKKSQPVPLKKGNALTFAGANVVGMKSFDQDMKSSQDEQSSYDRQGNQEQNGNNLNKSLVLPIIHSNANNNNNNNNNNSNNTNTSQPIIYSNPMMVIAQTIQSNTNNSPPPEKRSLNIPYKFDIDKKLPINLIYKSLQESINTYKYYLGGGNNVEIVRKVMQTREWWVETSESQTMFVHFKWQQGNRGYQYDRLVENQNYRQCVNHFQFHQSITNKQYLVENLQSYCQKIHQNVFDIIPLTFVIDLNSEVCQPALNQFVKFYQSNAPSNLQKNLNLLSVTQFQRKMRCFMIPNGNQRDQHHTSTQYRLPQTFVATDTNSFMWLLQPTFLNRGRGIHLFNDLNSLEQLISNYFYGYEEQAVNSAQTQSSSTKENNNQNQTQEVTEKKNSSASVKLTNNSNSQTLLQSQKSDNIITLSTIGSQNDEKNEIKSDENQNLNAEMQNEANRGPKSNAEPSMTLIQKIKNDITKKVENNQSFTLSPDRKNIIKKEGSVLVSNPLPLTQGRGSNTNIMQNIKSQIDNEFKTAAQQRGSSTSNYNSNQIQPIDFNQYMREIPAGPCILRATSFILQQYIEKPLLINKRKFDVRVWVLLTHELQIYFYPQGYIRTSSQEYSCDSKNLNNLFIHLTNNAIQQHSDTYGAFENGNQLSFSWFQRFLDSNMMKIDVRENLVQKIKDIIFTSMQSVQQQINAHDRKYTFEIFGYDFFIDEAFNVWLIQVNTNPCIEESSKLLQMLIPRMLDDAFKLTLDVIFPRKQKSKSPQQGATNAQSINNNHNNNQQNDLPNIFKSPMPSSPYNLEQKIDGENIVKQSIYPVIGYSDTENMWEYIGSINDNKEPNQSHSNHQQVKTQNKKN